LANDVRLENENREEKDIVDEDINEEEN